MKKSLFFFAAAALALTACTSEDEVTQTATQKDAPRAIAFDTYVPNTTRTAAYSGQAGVMNTTQLQTSGFGVFAQYSDGTPGAYNADDGSNFMWNQQVTYSSVWTYSPLKYWPNETAHDSQSPQALMDTRVDKLSFFAYAPFVDRATGAVDGTLDGVEYTAGVPNTDQYGIIKVTANNATTDPKVQYRVTTDPTKTVDLLWGVVPAGGLNYTDVAGNAATAAAGLPLLNLVKPAKDDRMKFLFQHALSKINFTVVGAFDQLTPGGVKDANTKVLVKEVKIYEGTAGSIKTDGWLNLNNTAANTALWESPTGGDFTSTPFATITNAELTASIKYNTESATYASQPEGVLSTETPLYADASKFFAVIPNDGTQFKVEITYYVQTDDEKLAGGNGSVVENVVTKTISLDLKSGKAYNLRLILGLTSVKLDAEVSDWQFAGSADVNLPQNK